jgi:2-polyprenyl-3-methyl-5-hydroxy-6-metoxy-1,4-benzoquinol methylase
LDWAVDQAIDHFERRAGAYAVHAEERPEFRDRFALWSAAIDRLMPAGGQGATALDLGCGPGHLTCALSARGFHTVAIDGSEAMLARTRDRLERRGLEADVRRSALPLPAEELARLPERADLILMSSVIEYLHADREMLAQCAQLLAPGAHALISFPNRRSVYWRAQRALRWSPLFAGSATRHQRRLYDPPTVWELARDAGLEMRSATFFALPLQRFTDGLLPKGRPRVATLFLSALQRPVR